MILSVIKMIVAYNRQGSDKMMRAGDIPGMREGMEKALNNPLIYVRCRSERVTAGTVPAEWVTRGKPGPVIIYFHGGGYLLGSPNTHRPLVASILARTGGRALVPDYRLAPEHPYPAQIEDACAVYQWLLDNGTGPSGIAVMGDSAGGHLAISMLQRLKKNGLPLPSCCAGLCAWTDTGLSGATMEKNADKDILLSREIMEYYSRAFAGPREISDPELSPLSGEMRGLPPILLQAGTDEILLDDSRRLERRLREAGVSVTLEEYPGMFHGFQLFSRFLGQGRRALDSIGRFVLAHTKKS